MSTPVILRFLDSVRAEELDYLAQWLTDPVPVECLDHLRYLMWVRYRQVLRNEPVLSDFQLLAEVYRRLLKQFIRYQYDESLRTPAQELKYLSIPELGSPMLNRRHPLPTGNR
ncbi:MAG: hypothetical protein HUU10_03820 [Bacteroidetes bacterium]|nr:hypothetical protein [Bacteroidota bacterium]